MLPIMLVAAEGAASWNGVTSDMLSALFDSIKELLPIALPAVVGFLGLRKGISFLLGLIRGA